jgi:hypothetical protein
MEPVRTLRRDHTYDTTGGYGSGRPIARAVCRTPSHAAGAFAIVPINGLGCAEQRHESFRIWLRFLGLQPASVKAGRRLIKACTHIGKDLFMCMTSLYILAPPLRSLVAVIT